MSIETLTDDERAELGNPEEMHQRYVGAKALRIIDSHAAREAALVAQLEAAKSECCLDPYECWKEIREEKRQLALDAESATQRAESLVAQVAELTRERDEARAELKAMMLLQRSTYLRAEAAESQIPRLCDVCCYTHRANEPHGRRRDVD